MLNVIAGWGSFIISIGVEIANDLDIGKLLNSFTNLVRAATEFGSKLTDVIIPALKIFYEESGLDDIVSWIGEKLAEGMDDVALTLDGWTIWLEDNKEQI